MREQWKMADERSYLSEKNVNVNTPAEAAGKVLRGFFVAVCTVENCAKCRTRGRYSYVSVSHSCLVFSTVFCLGHSGHTGMSRAWMQLQFWRVSTAHCHSLCKLHEKLDLA